MTCPFPGRLCAVRGRVCPGVRARGARALPPAVRSAAAARQLHPRRPAAPDPAGQGAEGPRPGPSLQEPRPLQVTGPHLQPQRCCEHSTCVHVCVLPCAHTRGVCLWCVCTGSWPREFVPREPAPPPADIRVYTVLGAQLPGPSILISGELGAGTMGEVAARLWGSAGLGLAGRALWGCSSGSRGHTFGRWIPGSVWGAGETCRAPSHNAASAPSVFLVRLHFQAETLQWLHCPPFPRGPCAWVSPQPCRGGSAATSPRLPMPPACAGASVSALAGVRGPVVSARRPGLPGRAAC